MEYNTDKSADHPIKDDDIVRYSFEKRRVQNKESIHNNMEFVRHRVFSFAQESTRYCNYSKDKFNNELTFIIPNWFTNESIYNNENVWEASMQLLENNYNFLIKEGWSHNKLVQYCLIHSKRINNDRFCQ